MQHLGIDKEDPAGRLEDADELLDLTSSQAGGCGLKTRAAGAVKSTAIVENRDRSARADVKDRRELEPAEDLAGYAAIVQPTMPTTEWQIEVQIRIHRVRAVIVRPVVVAPGV